MKSLRSGTYRYFIGGLIILYSLGFGISCFSYCISPYSFPWIIYGSLLFPVLFLGLIIAVIPFSFLIFRNRSWPLLLMLFPAWKNISVLIAPHIPAVFSLSKPKKQIRVLSWNINAFDFLYQTALGPATTEKRAAMKRFMDSLKADIICFQDYSETPLGYIPVNLSYLKDSLAYPYHYLQLDAINYGTLILSRIPLINQGYVRYLGKVYPESLVYVDIFSGKDTLRVYNTHLRSMYLRPQTVTIDNIGNLGRVKEDTAFLFHANRMERLQHFDRIHADQAEMIKQVLSATKHPYIFCADLNSVPSSYTYHHISEGLHDAFLEKGSGLGGTYYRFSPTLRIDVILTSPSIQTIQYYSPGLNLSDHYPIITDIQLNN